MKYTHFFKFCYNGSIAAFFFLAAFCISAVDGNAQTRYYVDSATGNDANPGLSWGAAYRNITKAVASANTSSDPSVEIWVSAGTYHATDGIAILPADHRDTSFTFYRGDGIGKALKVYGGFRGTETSIDERDTSHHSILYGGVGPSLFSYHLIVIAGLAAGADSVVVDGFTMFDGYGPPGITTKNFNGIVIPQNNGGGINLTKNATSKLAIRNCIFLTNSGGEGGGMMIDSSIALIEKCTFNGNYGTSKSGGGIYNLSSSLTIKNCYFYNNKANGYGAGIYNYISSPLITNCTFSSNTALLDFENGYGGAVYNYSSSPSIVNCVFSSNMVYGDGEVYGGAIYNTGTSTPFIDSCSFISNKAYVLSSGDAFGGAIYNQSCTPVITHSLFSGNMAFGDGDEFEGPSHSYGGAMYNYGSSVITTNCTYSGNISKSVADGGEFSYAYGGAIYDESSSVTITNCEFTADSAYGIYGFGVQGYAYGGAIYNHASQANVNNCQFRNDVATGTNFGYGGAFYNISASPVSLTGCTFEGNNAINYGGAIYHSDDKLNTNTCTFSNNSSQYGGAVCVKLTIVATPYFTSFKSVFNNNISTFGGGGAIYMACGLGTDSIINDVFIGNKDMGGVGGGAIDFIQGTHCLNNNTFYADSALSGGTGGALHFENYVATYKIANNIFYSNYGAGTSNDTTIAPSGIYTFAHNSYGSSDPHFIDAADPRGADTTWGTTDDGLALQRCSPARNSGDNLYVIAGELTDISGSPRIGGGIVDLGAYEVVPIGAIGGVHNICAGYTETLTDTTLGGSWISINTSVASITSDGIVTGIAPGTSTILYVISDACGTDTMVAIITVNAATDAGIITGPSLVCAGADITLTDIVTGGTWSATNGDVSVSGGWVTGITPGIDTIVYTNSCGMATATKVVTINSAPSAGTIAGPSAVCVGAGITLSDGIPGGTWASSNSSASISGIGGVTGISTGIDTISYTVTNTCGTDIAIHAITINSLPSAGTISGIATVCAGASILLTDAIAGGVWSVSNTHANITSAGTVTGISNGIDTIGYSVSNSCGTSTAHYVITINALPLAGTIIGVTEVCIGSTISLADAVSGGTWSSSNADASISTTGVVTGINAGGDTIKYTVTNTCGTAVTTHIITINSLPASITGATSVCIGKTDTLKDLTTGGTWASSNTAIATINALGIVTGIAAGSSTITYTNASGCYVTSFVTVIVCPSSVEAISNQGEVNIFPNPAQTMLNIVADEIISEIAISDESGRIIFKNNFSAKHIEVDVERFSPGIYFIRIDGLQVRKFIKL